MREEEDGDYQQMQTHPWRGKEYVQIMNEAQRLVLLS